MDSTPHPGWPQRLLTDLLVALTSYAAIFAVLIGAGSGTLEVSLVRMIYIAAAALIIVVWLLLAVWRPALLPSSTLTPAIGAVLAVFTITSVTSRSPRLSFEFVGYAVLLGGLYLWLVTAMRLPKLRNYLGWLALALCVTVAVLYLSQVLGAWQEWWRAVGRLTMPPMRPAYLGLMLGSPNPVATAVLLLGAFGLAASWRPGRRMLVLAIVLGVLIAVVTVITGSRGAWLGTAAGVVVCALVAALAWPELRRRVAGFVRTAYGAAFAAVALVALSGAVAFAAASGRLSLGDDGLRQGFWAAGIRMFESSPLVGVGPGVWQTLRMLNTNSNEPDFYIPHAHDVYVMTIAEFGILGVLAASVLLACLGRLLFDGLRSADSQRRLVALAALFGIVVLAVQQLVDMLMNVPALLLAIALPLAWLDSTSARTASARGVRLPRLPGWERLKPRAMAIAGIALTLVVFGGLVRIEAVTATSNQAVSEANAGHWSDALAPARQAALADPAVTSYRFQLGVIAANSGNLEEAAAAFEQAASADDYPYAWLNLAAVRWRLGDTTGARQAVSRSERLGWQRPPAAFGAGWLRMKLGDRDQAIDDYARALLEAPTLAGDPYWSTTPDGRSFFADVLAAVRQRRPGPIALFTIDLMAGNESAVDADLSPLAPSDRALPETVRAAWNGDGAAESRLQAAANASPHDDATLGWCSLIAAHNREASLVSRYSTWIGEGVAGSPPVTRIQLATTDTIAASPLDRYGSLYRRAIPDAQVVLILPQLYYSNDFG